MQPRLMRLVAIDITVFFAVRGQPNTRFKRARFMR
jgi:hypothetical protein